MLRAGLKILIKDALRSARDQVRRSGEGIHHMPLPGAHRLALVADDVLSSIEETVVSVRYGSAELDDLLSLAFDGIVRLYGAAPDPEFEATFAATFYRLAKGLLALRGRDRVRISERGIAMAGREVRRALERDPAMPTEVFAAEIAVQLAAAEPLRDPAAASPRNDDPFVTETGRALAVATGFAAAAWLERTGPVAVVECARSAVEIVGAAWPRFEAAIRSGDARAAMAEVYAELAPFAR